MVTCIFGQIIKCSMRGKNMKTKLINIRAFIIGIIALPCFFAALFSVNVYAKDQVITKGITIGTIDLSGMTEEEALNKGNEYINGFTSKNIELDMDGNKVTVTAGELGYYWKNQDVIQKAVSYCKEGNVIKRYKDAKDLEKKGVKYEFEVDVNDEVLTNTINEKCGKYNVPHVNASLTKAGSGFTVSQEATGRKIDMETSVKNIHDFLLNSWDGNDSSQKLVVVDDKPVATVADCQKVKDLIGTYSTKFSTGGSNYNRNANMENGMRLLNGKTVCQGETFSVNACLEPWTGANGWKEAGTYVNGKTENSLGGGICQVSTTLYNAALDAEIEIVERSNHSLTVGYVPLSMDAALAGTWKDLKIKNNTDTPIYIEAIYSAEGQLTFNIYGVETRPSNRRVEYVSETTGTIPSSEVVSQDPSLPSGYRAVTTRGHVGYKARLLKRIYIDGQLEKEEVVNTSSYNATPTYVTVGCGDGSSSGEAVEPGSEAGGDTTPSDGGAAPSDGGTTPPADGTTPPTEGEAAPADGAQ